LTRLRLGSSEQAREDFDQTIALAPKLAEGYLNRGLANDGLGRFAEAIADLTRALELGTPRTQVYFLRAAVRERARDSAGAKRTGRRGCR
jgi:tetratricopeptide (TPR) repeat protein